MTSTIFHVLALAMHLPWLVWHVHMPQLQVPRARVCFDCWQDIAEDIAVSAAILADATRQSFQLFWQCISFRFCTSNLLIILLKPFRAANSCDCRLVGNPESAHRNASQRSWHFCYLLLHVNSLLPIWDLSCNYGKQQ